MSCHLMKDKQERKNKRRILLATASNSQTNDSKWNRTQIEIQRQKKKERKRKIFIHAIFVWSTHMCCFFFSSTTYNIHARCYCLTCMLFTRSILGIVCKQRTEIGYFKSEHCTTTNNNIIIMLFHQKKKNTENLKLKHRRLFSAWTATGEMSFWQHAVLSTFLSKIWQTASASPFFFM